LIELLQDHVLRGPDIAISPLPKIAARLSSAGLVVETIAWRWSTERSATAW